MLPFLPFFLAMGARVSSIAELIACVGLITANMRRRIGQTPNRFAYRSDKARFWLACGQKLAALIAVKSVARLQNYDRVRDGRH